MSEKTFKIVNGDMSDGYHTFDELYEHRCLLYLLWLVEEAKWGAGRKREVFWVKDHFEGWDLVATNVGRKQISYHVPSEYRPVLEKCFVRKESLDDVFDGHTSQAVAQRMKERINDLCR